jgi:hypothetical protein
MLFLKQEGVSPVLSRKFQDGVIFVSECVNKIFTRGDLRCPQCGGTLVEETKPAGQAVLVCSDQGPTCLNPVKTFESTREMYEWRDTIWETIARTCRGQN